METKKKQLFALNKLDYGKKMILMFMVDKKYNSLFLSQKHLLNNIYNKIFKKKRKCKWWNNYDN